MTATTREPRPASSLDGEQRERLDLVVARSRAAADAFRTDEGVVHHAHLPVLVVSVA